MTDPAVKALHSSGNIVAATIIAVGLILAALTWQLLANANKTAELQNCMNHVQTFATGQRAEGFYLTYCVAHQKEG